MCYVFSELNTKTREVNVFLNKKSRIMMDKIRTTPHENPRALHAFSAKRLRALTKYNKAQATINI